MLAGHQVLSRGYTSPGHVRAPGQSIYWCDNGRQPLTMLELHQEMFSEEPLAPNVVEQCRLGGGHRPIKRLCDFWKSASHSFYLVEWEDSRTRSVYEDWILAGSMGSAPLVDAITSYFVVNDEMVIHWTPSWISVDDLKGCEELIDEYWRQRMKESTTLWLVASPPNVSVEDAGCIKKSAESHRI